MYQPIDHTRGRKAKIKELPERDLLPFEAKCAIVMVKDDVTTLLDAAICNICEGRYFQCRHVEGFIYDLRFLKRKSA